MAIERINTDRSDQRGILLARGSGDALPRQNRYGEASVAYPLGDAYPDELVDPKDYKEVIQHLHDEKMFPLYHQRATWLPKGERWNQNGLNWCWTWGCTACVMDVRAREGRDTVQLAPNSLGWLVGWRNRGYFLQDTINGAATRGIAPLSAVDDIHSRNPRRFDDDWQQQASMYRISASDVWDADNSSDEAMIQHLVTLFNMGVPIQGAWNWWRHTAEIAGLRWNERERYNLEVLVNNSHNEDDVIILTGRRAVPDEAYGIGATMTVL